MTKDASRGDQTWAAAIDGIKRRRLLRLGSLTTAVTGTTTIFSLHTNTASAAPLEKNPQAAYVPTAEKEPPLE